jgi:glycosyltransferase involved in cell wall biosynthesis
MLKKVSIITVVKNNEKFIKRTIESVISQDYENIEYIIIDGKSKDRTLEVLNKFKNKITKIISEEDDGIYDAMNKGLLAATGEIIGFCNSGDILRKNAITTIAKYLSNDSNLDFVFGTVWRFYKTTKILKSNFQPFRIYYNFDSFTSHSTGFYIKKRSQDKIGFYNTRFKCSADYDLYHRMIIKLKMKGAVTKKNEIIGVVQSGGFSSRYTFMEHLIEETKIRLHNKQNIIIIILVFAVHFIKNLKKIIK